MIEDLKIDEALQQRAGVNSPQNFGLHFRPKLEEAIASRHSRNGEVVSKIFEREGMLDFLAELKQRSLYREAQQQAQ